MSNVSLFKDLRNGISAGVADATRTAQRLTRYGRMQLRRKRLEHALRRSWQEMGERLFHLIERNPNPEITGDTLLSSASDRAKKIQAELSTLESELLDEPREASTATESPAQQSDIPGPEGGGTGTTP